MSAFPFDDAPDADKYSVCVHCGLCLDACPTYQELGLESQSPRGRVYLIKAVAEQSLPFDAAFADPIFRCLDCRACESVCPSGVQVGALIEEARGQIARAMPEKGLQGWFKRFMLRGVFMRPHRLQQLGRLLHAYQTGWFGRVVRRLGIVRWLPDHVRVMERALPPVPAFASRQVLAYDSSAVGLKRGRVGLFCGCVADVLFAGTNLNTAAVLQRNGFDVVMPKEQVCCGALHVHAGDRQAAKQLARMNIEVFRKESLDAVIVNAAGCGAALKEYPALLREDPEYSDLAQVFAQKTHDVSWFLVTTGLLAPKAKLPIRVTYHDACHLCHAQHVRDEPRQLLCTIPGLELVEMPESDRCCGAAGIYNLTHPDMSRALLRRKLADIPSDVDTVATGNPGCTLQLLAGARQTGRALHVVHPVDLLALAYKAERSS